MTIYKAPGVYVEEIPSAQQPIAGVGTNTVAFIGIVPPQIQYPVPKEYNPYLAKKQSESTATGSATLVDSAAIKSETATLEGSKKIAVSSEDNIKIEPDIHGSKAESEKNKTENSNKIKGSKTELEEAPPSDAAPTANKDTIRPYQLETFDVKPAPFITKLCTTFTDYTKNFGPFSADDPDKEHGVAFSPGHRALTHAVYGFFRAGGTRCFVVRVESDNEAELDKALKAVESIEAVAIVASPGLDQNQKVWDQLIAHCAKTEDRFAILDSPAEVNGTDGDFDITLLSYDNANSVLPKPNKNAAFYFPWIEVIDPAVELQDQDPARNVEKKYRGRVFIPPSGHVAGIYARTDAERGVHKAPANVAISGALNVKYYLSKIHQERLNPQGVNCIRNINGSIQVWGARTIGPEEHPEWKYINVRRVMLFLRDSIDHGTQWVVFEPNDIALWGKIRRNVTAFLTNVWRSGALFGATPEEAFYVKCDAELNPPEVRDLGQVITEIGVAIVRPAEFVIFRISQSNGTNPTN
ncbi:MAG: phage tail sheath family protein [Methylococcaceae bacterium]|nr:phage tail sheath family protein [Methylococcaceae bacterium]